MHARASPTAAARSRKRRRVIPEDPGDATPAPRDVIVIDGSPEEAVAADPAPPPARRRGAAVAAPPEEATTNPLLRAAASPPPAAPAPAPAPAQPRRGAASATSNPMHARDSPTANRTRRRSRGAAGIDDPADAMPAKRPQTLVISASGVDPAGRTALRAAAAAVARAGGGRARFADDELLAKLCVENLLDGVAMSLSHRSTEPVRPRHRREMT